MPLVDYSSSSDSGSADDAAPPAKRRKSSADTGAAGAETPGQKQKQKEPPSDLPPLPEAFHDLYASTVRHSVADDPSLHHGRRRQIPHVVGNWPSHLYVEWHPTASEHASLVSLVEIIQEELGGTIQLNSFLTSDLGAPLPLHISLSRPIALTTGEKDTFLDKVTDSIKSAGVSTFTVSPDALTWYKSPDSARAFLVLRVANTIHRPAPSSNKRLQTIASNPQLRSLLARCNALVTSFGQPALYQQDATELVDDAFHVSIAWTFDLPDEETQLNTCGILGTKRFTGIRGWKILVGGLKAKIGNVVTHIPLGGGKGLF